VAKFLYKLTDEFGSTRNNTHWSEGIKHEIAKELRDNTRHLCSVHYLHAYENPLVAVFMNPAHAGYFRPMLWQATGRVQKREGQLKCGCFSLRVVQRVQLPEITLNQRVRAAIYCALTRPQADNFIHWANEWLSGRNRTQAAANVAQAAAYTAIAYTAAYATDAAYAAAVAAESDATDATDAAYAAAQAAQAVVYADATPFNLIKILKRAIKEEAIIDRQMAS
jgi:hypothetical protein